MSDVSERPGARLYTVFARRRRRTTWDGGRTDRPDFTPAEVHPEGASRVAEPKARRGTGDSGQAPGDGPAGRERGERDASGREVVTGY